MKIPTDLSKKIDEEPTLIIVAGRQDAVLYKTNKGTVVELDEFIIPKPNYGDHKAEIKKKAKGKTTGSHEVWNRDNSDVVKYFLKELKRRIKKVTGFERLYILAPSQTKNKIKAALPTAWHKKIRLIIDGNYFYRHPLFILKKIVDNEKQPRLLAF
ncbi:TPA: hypothetical protein DCQ44_03290 [Candidatus Taylorbacteria bacterium]|nr:hypothetical protein [Candidatus Taylorbacteria bacterium]